MAEYFYDYSTKQNNSYGANKINTPFITIILIAINVIIFAIMEMDLSILYQFDAMYSPDVFERGKWYQLVTSMFIHFGYEHLLNNMLMLGILGMQLENKYGRIRYLITYFVCGIMGNIISGLSEMATGDYSISAGASGAIFGIFGVLLVMVFKSRRKMGQVSAPRLILLFILMVFGNMQEGVDWVAHLGGALTGVVMAWILYRPSLEDELLNL